VWVSRPRQVECVERVERRRFPAQSRWSARDKLPVCLALHGRHSVAAVMVSLGLPEFLGAAVQAGSAPFAVVAVDGGDSYRVAQTPGDDPQAMLRTELPGWLTSFGLTAHGGVPTSVLGISAGCFGALVYARARTATAPAGVPAVAVLSPALFRSWSDTLTVHAFTNQAVWASSEPLRHPTPLPRLACGAAGKIRSTRRPASSSRSNTRRSRDCPPARTPSATGAGSCPKHSASSPQRHRPAEHPALTES
jgi:S-formylglutathione hydrolase FrmB